MLAVEPVPVPVPVPMPVPDAGVAVEEEEEAGVVVAVELCAVAALSELGMPSLPMLQYNYNCTFVNTHVSSARYATKCPTTETMRERHRRLHSNEHTTTKGLSKLLKHEQDEAYA